ncbi:MAG: RraA family protein [Chloroflexi bacterium]|nr:RraA family protein [Chloroflexota bacterium]
MAFALSATQLDALKRITTPTIANAVEVFNVRSRSEGFMLGEIRCILSELGTMVGHAVTAKIRAKDKPADGASYARPKMWEYILSVPPPRVVVIEDLDPVPVGSFWGEVQGNIHKALACVGAVTNGGVRDLDEVRALGFHLFARQVLVSHAYVHVVEVGTPVTLGGLTVSSGDVVHGDQHGVMTIPSSIVDEIPAAVRKLEQDERAIIELCQSPEFSAEKLAALYAKR